MGWFTRGTDDASSGVGVVCSPKGVGGLGFKPLIVFNKLREMFMKVHYRKCGFVEESGGVEEVVRKGSGGLGVKGTYGVGLWKAVRKGLYL